MRLPHPTNLGLDAERQTDEQAAAERGGDLATFVSLARVLRRLDGSYGDCAVCHAEGVELACDHGRALCAGCADLCGECHDEAVAP